MPSQRYQAKRRMMTNIFDEEITELKSKLSELDKTESRKRIKIIDIELFNGILDEQQLSEQETLYVHSRLHFFYHMKKTPIKKDNLVKLHSIIKLKLINHRKYDHLDD